jgi:hypothetical protein
MERYNELLSRISSGLAKLNRGVQGLEVITPELEVIMTLMQ